MDLQGKREGKMYKISHKGVFLLDLEKSSGIEVTQINADVRSFVFRKSFDTQKSKIQMMR